MQQVTVTFFHFQGRSRQWWMLGQMQRAHPHLTKAHGLSFYKLMGSGGGHGFSLWPDWSVYALLSVWEHTEAAQAFFGDPTSYYHAFAHRCQEAYTLFLRPQHVQGQWSGKQPFQTNGALSKGPVAVLTRARIRWRHVWGFWRFVPGVSDRLQQHPGCLLAKGVGEWPLIQQATFSVWTSEEAMKNYAYGDENHVRVIRETRRRGWYSEEMFARFGVEAAHGQWGGRNPLRAAFAER